MEAFGLLRLALMDSSLLPQVMMDVSFYGIPNRGTIM